MSSTAPAGWYPDPASSTHARYFDGRAWTDQIRPLPTSAPKPNPFLAPPQTTTPTSIKVPFKGPTSPETWTAGVALGTTQALLLEENISWQQKERPTTAEPGWYPDPGRSRKLRFYDGQGWTARVRVPLEAQMKQLPKAAIAARARLLAIADEQAVKAPSTGATWRTPAVVRIQQPQSLHRVTRSKTGRVGGMASMALILIAVSMALFAGWQEFGSDTWQRHNQNQLRETLAQQFEEQGGEYTTTVSTDPTPLDAERPELRVDLPFQNPTQPTSPPAPPKLNDQPPDITPFPPTGWSPPANRTIKNLQDYPLGVPVGRVIIPRMGLDEVMVSGVGPNELAKGPGVARYGVLPGSPGNAVIAGHRTGWGEPFRNLDQLRYGDQIIIEIPGQQRSVYEVRGRSIVSPQNTNVVKQTPGVRLTLTTCHPVSINTHRMIVQAEMVEGPWLDKAINRSTWQTLE